MRLRSTRAISTRAPASPYRHRRDDVLIDCVLLDAVHAVDDVRDATRPQVKEVALSNRGTLWSYTTNHYKPPEPAISKDPFEPYTVAAVELNDERMVVLGQLADGVSPDDIEVGMEMQLVLGTLYEDDEHEYMVWKWKPASQ